MSPYRNLAGSIAALAIVGSGAFVSPAHAQSSAYAPDAWQFHAVIYGWGLSIDGNSSYPPPSGRTIEVSSEKILDSLNFAFMGQLEAYKGRWGGFTDVVYADLGASKSGTRDLQVGGGALPAGISANASLDVKGWAWTLAGSYRAVITPEVTADVFAGVRLLDLKERLGWEFSADFAGFTGPGRNGSSESKVQNWDGIVGVRGRWSFGQKREWFVPYYLDVGTGESDFTWQGLAGLGYAFSWGEIIAAYRYLDYDFKSGEGIQSVTFSGPVIGVGFRW